MTTPTPKDKDEPFLKSLRTLKGWLASPAGKQALTHARNEEDDGRETKDTTIASLEQQLQLEIQQRKALETAVTALTQAREGLQQQLATLQSQRKEDADKAKQQRQELQTQHVADLTARQQQLEKVQQELTKAQQEKQTVQQDLATVEASVARLQLQNKEAQDAIQQQKDLLRTAQSDHQTQMATQQRSVQVLLQQLKEARAEKKAAVDEVERLQSEAEMAVAEQSTLADEQAAAEAMLTGFAAPTPTTAGVARATTATDIASKTTVDSSEDPESTTRKRPLEQDGTEAAKRPATDTTPDADEHHPTDD